MVLYVYGERGARGGYTAYMVFSGEGKAAFKAIRFLQIYREKEK